MRRYEVAFVLAPTTTEEEAKQLVGAYSTVASEQGATVLNIDEWGKRQLAFPVKKFNDGLYYIMTLEEPAAQATKELERRFKVADAVIRFLTVRIDESLKRAEKFKHKREARAARKKSAPAKRRDRQERPKEDSAPTGRVERPPARGKASEEEEE